MAEIDDSIKLTAKAVGRPWLCRARDRSTICKAVIMDDQKFFEVFSSADEATQKLLKSAQFISDAAHQAMSDDKNSEIECVFIAFDNSLIHPLLSPKAPIEDYDTVGNNIFRLFETYGNQTKYRLVLTSGAHDEMLSSLSDTHTRAQKWAGLPDHNNKDLLTSEEILKELNNIETSSNRINRGLEIQKRLIKRRLLLGSANVFSEAPDRIVEHDPLFQYIEKAIDRKNKGSFSSVCDKRVAYTILHFADSFEHKPLAYCGEERMLGTIADQLPKHVRDPLSLLLKLYSLYQASPEIDINLQSLRYLNNVKDGFDQMIDIILFYKRISLIQDTEWRNIERIRFDYYHPLFKRILDESYPKNTIGEKEKMKNLNDKDIKDNLNEQFDSHKNKVRIIHDLMDDEWDERLYGDKESLTTEDFLKRRDRIRTHFEI